MVDHLSELVPDVLSEVSRQRREVAKRRQAGQFVRGPLPMPWLEQAARLPGKTLAVGLLLWFIRGMKGNEPIKLHTALLVRFGIGRKAAYRALTALQAAGLVMADRALGRLARVKILEAKPRG